MKLYLIRHGEVEDNAKVVLLGWRDVSLNGIGRRQSADAADGFNKDSQAIFCSDLKRCQETAQPFRAKFPGAAYFLDWRLRERYFGSAQGKPRAEAFPAGASDVVAEDAESVEHHRLRMLNFVENMKSMVPSFDSILIVTHNGSINRLREALLQADDMVMYDNGQIIEFEI